MKALLAYLLSWQEEILAARIANGKAAIRDKEFELEYDRAELKKLEARQKKLRDRQIAIAPSRSLLAPHDLDRRGA